MHDFIKYLVRLFQQGIFWTVPMLCLCLIALAVGYGVCRKKGKHVDWKKWVLLLLLAGWGFFTAFVTLFRTESGTRLWNFHIFLAWREAWNAFSLQGWLNIFLNIAIFLPLGVLLPFVANKFRKMLPMFLAGFTISLLIELAQLVLQKGVCDIDDLFANTLGAMLGWSLVMGASAIVHRKENGKTERYRFIWIPTAFLVALAVIFGGYYLKPYGNLTDAAVKKANIENIEWIFDVSLSDTEEKTFVYEAGRVSAQEAENFLKGVMQNTGIEFPDRYDYDDLILFANHSTGDFWDLDLKDGTWEYQNTQGKEIDFAASPSQITADALSRYLSLWGISVPSDALFFAEKSAREDAFDIGFTAKLHSEETQTYYGEIRCTFSEENGKTLLKKIQNDMVLLNPCQEEEIITQKEAAKRLCDGQSFYGAAWEVTKISQVRVLSCDLEWIADTKGFYQPLYRFTLALSEDETATDYIPALT